MRMNRYSCWRGGASIAFVVTLFGCATVFDLPSHEGVNSAATERVLAELERIRVQGATPGDDVVEQVIVLMESERLSGQQSVHGGSGMPQHIVHIEHGVANKGAEIVFERVDGHGLTLNEQRIRPDPSTQRLILVVKPDTYRLRIDPSAGAPLSAEILLEEGERATIRLGYPQSGRSE